MKKLFTLVALLTCFLGAKADNWGDQPIYSIDYTTYQGFPFYVMGYVPEFDNGCMADYGAGFGYKTDAEMADFTGGTEVGTVTTQGGVVYHKVQLDAPAWHQYFAADGIPTKIDGKYKVVAKVKASEDVTINVNMGWSWSEDPVSASVTIPQSDEFVEVTWQYMSGINGSSCNLVAQPGGSTATIEWERIDVYSWVKEGGREPVWAEDIVNGDAETPWTAEQQAIKFDDQTQNYTICAWSKEKGVNMNEKEGWDPFVAPIEDDPTGEDNKVFVCHGQPATSESGSDWDNQFWIQSQHSWKSGLTMKIKFRYMSNRAESFTVATQFHKQTPSDYLIWHSIGDVTFKNEWQTFDKEMAIADDMAGGWSIAFNLNSSVKEAVNFYFDDLSWKYLVLDEGYFLAGINSTATKEYEDLDNAIPFEYDEDDALFKAVIGEAGNADSYVDQLMISTTRGDDQAFKGATLKPSGKIVNDPDNWNEMTASVNAKLDVPGLGVWKVYIDEEYESMAFEMLEGTPYEQPDPVAIVTNATEIKIEAVEREYTAAEAEAAGVETPENPGNTWDNQFFLYSNRNLKPGEVTVLEFDYKATGPAKSSAAFQGIVAGNPDYITGAFSLEGDDAFDTEVKHYKKELTMPAKKWDGAAVDAVTYMTFDLACIKEANTYTFTNIKWYLKDDELNTAGQTLENLINETGEANFAIKIGAGTNPVPMGIENVSAKGAKTSTVMYNLAGQRVANNFKGIVIKDGKKFVK